MQDDPRMFLGYPIPSSTIEAAQNRPFSMKKFPFEAFRPYLHLIEYQGASYLGKWIDDVVDSDAVVLLSANILSVLKKVTPQITYNPNALVVIGMV